MVPAGVSGYCECGGGRRVREVGCSHGEFLCAEECDAPVRDGAWAEQTATRAAAAGLAAALWVAACAQSPR